MRMPMTSPLDILAPDERELVREAPAPTGARLMKAVLHRQSLDARRAIAPPALPGTARRQSGHRGGARAMTGSLRTGAQP
jgi:hypothetical protein